MSTTDPIADMLTRIRNAVLVRQGSVTMPASRMKKAIAQVLKDEGFIHRFEIVRDGQFSALKIHLKYAEDKAPVLTGIERVSKPGCRVYVGSADIPWVRSGLGAVVLSTSRGVMSGRQARKLGVGGEVICKVW